MAAKTFDEFWKIIDVPHSRQGDDYVFAKELTRLAWGAATKAAEEKFTTAKVPEVQKDSLTRKRVTKRRA